MILLLAVIVSISLALLRGGHFPTLIQVPVRWGVLAVAAFAIQPLFIYQAPTQKALAVWGWQEWLFFASHVLLLGVVWANRSLPGVKLIGLGLLLNLAAMLANGGWMPVTAEAVVRAGYTSLAPSLQPGMRLYSSKNIVLPLEQTRLWFLSDIFLLARPFPVPSVFSLGDVAIAAGGWALIQRAMLRRENRLCQEA
jgi:hypothetical protein